MPTLGVRYTTPAPRTDREPCFLIASQGAAEQTRCPFYDQIEIGRDDGRPDAAGTILMADASVSRRHCVISRRADGRCFIRDVSRNGTRVDGRRLPPSVEVELRSGQTISVAAGADLVLEGAAPTSVSAAGPETIAAGTVPASALTLATLLVGDIRDYTVLVRRAPSAVLQQSVNRVFEILSDAVGHLGGTVKEFQGDALVAFWEGNAHGPHVAAMACHAALELDRQVRHLATDRSIWQIEDFGLEIDWALASGPVMVSSFGSSQAGLSMIGEPIVLAFRLEKFANADTGRILTCPVTQQMAGPRFAFRNLGQMLAKGFDKPDRVFALERELPDHASDVGASTAPG